MEVSASSPRSPGVFSLLERVFPRQYLLSPLVAVFPVVFDTTSLVWSIEGWNLAQPNFLFAHLLSGLVIATVLAILPAITPRIPYGWIFSSAPLFFIVLSLGHHQLLRWISRDVFAASFPDSADWLGMGLVWVGFAGFGWFLAGQGARIWRARTRCDTLRQDLTVIANFQRNQVQQSLRSLLRELTGRIDRVVAEMTLERPVPDQPQARTLPHRDTLADQLVKAVDEKIYAAITASPSLSQTSRWDGVRPMPEILQMTVFAGLLGSFHQGPWSSNSLLGAMVAITIIGVGTWLLEQISGAIPPTALRALPLVGSVGVTYGSLLVLRPSARVGESGWGEMLLPIGLGVSVAASLLSLVLGFAASELSDRKRRVLELVHECEQLTLRQDALTSTSARSLYSATLGTLIFASVDLSNTQTRPETKDAALGTMAQRITAEVEQRVLHSKPFPEEHLRMVLGIWQAVIPLDVRVHKEVFSRFIWGDESIRRLQDTIGGFLLETYAVSDSGLSLSLREHSQAVVASIRYQGLLGSSGEVTAERNLWENTVSLEVPATSVKQAQRIALDREIFA